MTFAKSERTELADLFDTVGPDAPTLCEGWTTADLAAHLWMREHDPLGAPGLVAKPLAGLTERRMAEIKGRWPFPELVQKIRTGPGPFSLFAIPGVDGPANAIEYFIHHEDVRRAGDAPLPPRALDPSVEDWMWRRLKLLGRAFFRRAPVGVTLERRVGVAGQDAPHADLPHTDFPRADAPPADADVIRAAGGPRIVTLIGRPGELMLFAFGRAAAADVDLVGEPDAVEALTDSDLGA